MISNRVVHEHVGAYHQTLEQRNRVLTFNNKYKLVIRTFCMYDNTFGVLKYDFFVIPNLFENIFMTMRLKNLD